MIAKWDADKFIDHFTQFGQKKTVPDAKTEIEDFLDGEDIGELNNTQRIILLAEDFDYEVLVTAEWLLTKFRVDIRCYRLSLAIHDDDTFLSCTRIFPPTELTSESISPEDRNASERIEFKDLDSLIEWIDNPALVDFLRQELTGKWDRRAARRRIRLKSGKKTRLILYIKRGHVYVLQLGRFQNDEKFWKSLLSSDADVKVITHGGRVRFRLRSQSDFSAFRSAWQQEVSKLSFESSESPDEQDDDDTESDE